MCTGAQAFTLASQNPAVAVIEPEAILSLARECSANTAGIPTLQCMPWIDPSRVRWVTQIPLAAAILLALPPLSQENSPTQRSLPPRVSRLCSGARPSLPLDALL